MGRNVDLIRMCGLPTEIEYRNKKYNIEDQLRDYLKKIRFVTYGKGLTYKCSVSAIHPTPKEVGFLA